MQVKILLIKNLDILDGQKCEDHFKILFTKIEGDIESTMPKIDKPISRILDEQFSIEELKNTIKELKYNKAVGPDSIANEFLKQSTNEILELTLNFLNLNLKNGMTCSGWCLDLIALIHKIWTQR